MQRSTLSGSLLLALSALWLVACSAAPEDQKSAVGGAPPGTSGSGGSGGTTLVTGTGGGLSGSGGSSSGGESCDGFDDDGDGLVDEGCNCTPGKSQSCFPWDKSKQGLGSCLAGTQVCEGSGEFGKWGVCEGAVGPETETCDDGIDQDCDGSDASCGAGGAAGTGGGTSTGGAGGAGGSSGCVPKPELCGNGIDEDCDGKDQPCSDVVCQSINLFGDCLTVSCPSNAPYPKSCNVFFTPGDDRGCVASTPSSSVVYFQAGDQCNAGFVTGTLCCSKTPQAALTQQSCPINKPKPFHVASSAECPATK